MNYYTINLIYIKYTIQNSISLIGVIILNILITDTETDIGNNLKSILSTNNIIFGFTKDSLYLPDKSKTFEIIESIKPDLVIHTSSIESLELCEENESMAYSFNTLGSLNTAYPCSVLNIPLAYFSTSYVYDGKKQFPYCETDDCYPLNIFGKTKLASEKLIRTLCKKYFIIRTSWIFGGEDCFVKNIIKNKDAEIFMCTEEIGNPTYINEISTTFEKIMQSNLYGIYHCASSDYVSKLNWVKYIFELLNIKKEVISLPKSIINKSIPKPQNASLNTKLIKNCFDIELPSWKVSLEEYIKNLKI